MKHLFKPQIIKKSLFILMIMLFIKILWFITEIVFLPSNGVNFIEQKSTTALYYRVKLTPNQTLAPVIKRSNPKKQRRSYTIKDIKLLAIYNDLNATVVTVKYKSKTKILSRGEEINGFILEGAEKNLAIFTKNSKTYKLRLLQNFKDNNPKSTSILSSSYMQKSKKKPKKGDIVDRGDYKIIDRSVIEFYTNKPSNIYKDIRLSPINRGRSLAGFRINFIKKGSYFSKLGIQRNDIIKSANGQEINSNQDAVDLLKNIKNIENLTLVIQRGKEEMELEYETN